MLDSGPLGRIAHPRPNPVILSKNTDMTSFYISQLNRYGVPRFACCFLECSNRVTALMCIITDDALHITDLYSRVKTLTPI